MKLILSALLLLASASAAFAAGMPQLDFSTPLTISQVVWGALIFVVLYLLLSRWGLPEVAGVLQTRAQKISGDLEAARAAKDKADAAVDELRRATREAHAGAQTEIAEAVAAAKAAAEQQSAAINARLDAQIAGAEQRIAEARASAFAALEQVAVDTANVVVSRLIGTSIDHEAVPKAVAAVLAERGT
jgi:F-type H+-transporting ATPase subunit b